MTIVSLLVILVGAAASLASLRLLRGPTAADRVVALDLLFTVAVALSFCAALASEQGAFVDVAVVLALVGFVGTLAWARLIERQAEAAGGRTP